MKHAWKVIKILLLTILSAVLLLFVIAELFEDKITDIALNKIRESIDTPIEIKDVSFSLLKEFPLATVELSDVWLGKEVKADQDSSITSRIDTLVRIEKTYLSVYVFPLLKGKYELNEVELEGAHLKYHVDSIGASNFDFLMAADTIPAPEDTLAASAFSLLLDKFRLKRVTCNYGDDQLKAKAMVYIPNVEMKGEITNDNIDINVEGQIRLTDCSYDQTNLHLMNLTEVAFDLDYQDDNVGVNTLNIDTDGAVAALEGQINLKDTISTDIKVTQSIFNIGELVKYIPSEIINEYKVKQLAGQLSVEAAVKGAIADSLLPYVAIRFNLVDGKAAVGEHPEVKKMDITGQFTNGEERNNQTTRVNIESFNVETARNSQVTGVFSLHNLDQLVFETKTNVNFNLEDAKPYLPDTLVQELTGQVALKVDLKGQVPDSITDEYINTMMNTSVASLNLDSVSVRSDSLITIKNVSGQLDYQSRYLKLNGLKLFLPAYQLTLADGSMGVAIKGILTQLAGLELKVDSFNLKTPESYIKGQTTISDLTHPRYQLKGDMLVNVGEVTSFLPDSIMKQASGTIKAAIQSAGSVNLDSIADQAADLALNKSVIQVAMNQLRTEMPDTLMNINQLSGSIRMDKDTIKINGLKGKYLGMDFGADSTQIANISRAVLKKDSIPVTVDGNFSFGAIDYAMFTPFLQEDGNTTPSTNVEEENNTELPQFVVKGSVSMESFKYQKALFSNISALFNVSNDLYIIDQFNVDAFKGHINSSVKVQMMADNKIKTNFKTHVEQLDINQLLLDFDDFKDYGNEGYISHTQLSGALSTDNLNGVILMQDSLITDSLMMSGDLKLEEGALKKYDIAMEMGKDYGIDGLDDIQFKTTETKFFIYSNAVYVPQTNIKTNAFDISILGMQNFNLDCQYHLRFYLKEILRKGKTDRIERKQSNEKKQKDDGGTKGLTSLFAIYKVEDGKTVKSFLEGKDSDARKEMKREIMIKEAFSKLAFHPKIVNYNTGVEK